MKELEYIDTLLMLLKDAKPSQEQKLLEIVNAVNWLVGIKGQLQKKAAEEPVEPAPKDTKKKVK